MMLCLCLQSWTLASCTCRELAAVIQTQLSLDSQYECHCYNSFCFVAIYYFFKLHDFDNNNQLDGLELIAAFTDYHETPDSDHQDVLAGHMMLETEIERVVDDIIANHDLNHDGYLSWQEVASSDSRLLMNKIHDGLD